jgi:hypothetical protein
MDISSLSSRVADYGFRSADPVPPHEPTLGKAADDPQLKETFHDFVGQTVFAQMLGAMRKTVGKPAYMHGGRAEEVFQAQLDQALAERLSDASAATFAEPMYQLFMLTRT